MRKQAPSVVVAGKYTNRAVHLYKRGCINPSGIKVVPTPPFGAEGNTEVVASSCNGSFVRQFYSFP